MFWCELEVLHVEIVLVYPREKWAISGIPDLITGDPSLGVLGVRESPAWIYNCVLTCVGQSGNRG